MSMELLMQILGQSGAAQGGSLSNASGAQGSALASVIELVRNNPKILAAVLALLNPRDESVGGSNGMADLLSSMSQGGLGAAATSWIGNGPNQAVDPEALAAALGPEVVGQFAESAGIKPDEAGPVLASLLPGLVNEMTPRAEVPEAVDLDVAITSMFGRLGGR